MCVTCCTIVMLTKKWFFFVCLHCVYKLLFACVELSVAFLFKGQMLRTILALLNESRYALGMRGTIYVIGRNSL